MMTINYNYHRATGYRALVLSKTLIAFCILFLSSSSLAMEEKKAATTLNVDKSGVAIDGYDPVAYFTEKKAMKGDKAYTADFRGATFRFASAQHRDIFIKNPVQFVPQYEGFCAFHATQNKRTDVKPTSWEVVDNKLYLLANKRIEKLWKKDMEENIKLANERWRNPS